MAPPDKCTLKQEGERNGTAPGESLAGSTPIQLGAGPGRGEKGISRKWGVPLQAVGRVWALMRSYTRQLP